MRTKTTLKQTNINNAGINIPKRTKYIQIIIKDGVSQWEMTNEWFAYFCVTLL